jgi:MFS family permease
MLVSEEVSRMLTLWIPVLVLIGLTAWKLSSDHDPERRGRFLREEGLIFTGLIAGFFALFVIASAMEDPGGWEGAAIVAAWVLPIAGLGALAWFWPRVATVVLGVIVVAVFGLFVWSGLHIDWWRTFEDDHGPIRSLLLFATIVPVAVLGWRRPLIAAGLLGGCMLAVAAVAVLYGSGIGNAILMAASPALVTAVLYVMAARLGSPQPQQPGHTPSMPP